MLCSFYQKGKLPHCSDYVDVSLLDVLACMVGLQYFLLHWISGQALEWFFGACYKTLAICNEYYRFRIAVLLFGTLFLMVKRNKANILKGNKPIVSHALLGQRQLILKVLGQICAAFYSIDFKFYKHLNAGKRSNRVVLKKLKIWKKFSYQNNFCYFL